MKSFPLRRNKGRTSLTLGQHELGKLALDQSPMAITAVDDLFAAAMSDGRVEVFRKGDGVLQLAGSFDAKRAITALQ